MRKTALMLSTLMLLFTPLQTNAADTNISVEGRGRLEYNSYVVIETRDLQSLRSAVLRLESDYKQLIYDALRHNGTDINTSTRKAYATDSTENNYSSTSIKNLKMSELKEALQFLTSSVEPVTCDDIREGKKVWFDNKLQVGTLPDSRIIEPSGLEYPVVGRKVFYVPSAAEGSYTDIPITKDGTHYLAIRSMIKEIHSDKPSAENRKVFVELNGQRMWGVANTTTTLDLKTTDSLRVYFYNGSEAGWGGWYRWWTKEISLYNTAYPVY